MPMAETGLLSAAVPVRVPECAKHWQRFFKAGQQFVAISTNDLAQGELGACKAGALPLPQKMSYLRSKMTIIRHLSLP